MIRFSSLFTLFILAFPFFIVAKEDELAAKEREVFLAKYGIKEFTLKNGTRVCLKHTDYEDEFSFQLFAMGGYAALAPADRSSAILSPAIAWESGLNQQSADQLACDLYQHSLEIEPKIQAFDRLIEASGPKEELERCLQLTQALFTKPQFEQDALRKVLAETRDSLQCQTKAQFIDTSARNIFLKFNTQNWDIWNPLALSDLNQINLKKAEKLFKQFFCDPSEFVLVLVGDLNFQTLLPLLEQYLGSIPKKSSFALINPTPPAFPEGITKKEIVGFSRYTNTLTRLTFPISIKQMETQSLDFLCDLLFNRFAHLFVQTFASKKNLDVSYEFPLFPRLDEAWLVIEFSSSATEVPQICRQILKTLEELKSEGPSSEEIACSLKNVQDLQESEIQENAYILSLISNYYRANWDLVKLYQKQSPSQFEKDVVKNKLNSYFNLDHYSIISLHP